MTEKCMKCVFSRFIFFRLSASVTLLQSRPAHYTTFLIYSPVGSTKPLPILDLGARRWVVSATPRPLYPRKRQPIPIRTRGSVGLGACLDGSEKCRTGVRTPDRPYIDYATPDPHHTIQNQKMLLLIRIFSKTLAVEKR